MRDGRSERSFLVHVFLDLSTEIADVETDNWLATDNIYDLLTDSNVIYISGVDYNCII